MKPFKSILDVFLHNAKEYGDDTAALVKLGNSYRPVSWRTLHESVWGIAMGLVRAGVKAGDRVAMISETCLEWVECDLGIMAAGAVTVPVYPTSLSDACQHVINDAGATVVFVENKAQADKLRAERSRLSDVRCVVQLHGDVAPSDSWVLGVADFVAGDIDADILETRRQALTPDSVLTIIYTSGTTGPPKGVVLTHDAMLYEAECICDLGIVQPNDVQFLFLPLAHSFAKLLMISWIATRHTVGFAVGMDTIQENLLEVRPTIMGGVPRVFEKFHGAVVQKGLNSFGLKASMFRRACVLSARRLEAERGGAPLSWRERAELVVLDRLVFSKIAVGLGAALGGRMRTLVSGGAPLSPTICAFFRDAGLEILEGYGLTETSAGTFIGRPGHHRIGTVGQVVPGTQVRLADDGEILVRGRGVMRGYWQNPEATAEVLQEDGWLHTGDIGVLDADGFLTITDRKKDIIVTAGGKNISPQNIENLLKTHGIISQAMVHGDRRKFLSALITVEGAVLDSLGIEYGWGNQSYAVASQRAEVLQRVEGVVKTVNQQLASFETIKQFKILERDFSQEGGELTPTLKIRRKVITQRNQAVLDGFYET